MQYFICTECSFYYFFKQKKMAWYSWCHLCCCVCWPINASHNLCVQCISIMLAIIWVCPLVFKMTISKIRTWTVEFQCSACDFLVFLYIFLNVLFTCDYCLDWNKQKWKAQSIPVSVLKCHVTTFLVWMPIVGRSEFQCYSVASCKAAVFLEMHCSHVNRE